MCLVLQKTFWLENLTMMVQTMMTQFENTTNMQASKPKTEQRYMPFRCTRVPLFGEVISRYGPGPDKRELKTLTEMSSKIQMQKSVNH